MCARADGTQITIASGGETIDVVKLCQEDMEKIAVIRSRLELEREKADIKLASLDTSKANLEQQLRTMELRIGTLEEQLNERAEAVLDLSEQAGGATASACA